MKSLGPEQTLMIGNAFVNLQLKDELSKEMFDAKETISMKFMKVMGEHSGSLIPTAEPSVVMKLSSVFARMNYFKGELFNEMENRIISGMHATYSNRNSPKNSKF